MILLDTSGLLAALAANQRSHVRAREALESASPPYLLSPFVLAELDYLLAREGGRGAELALLEEVAGGAYDLVTFAAEEIAEVARVIDRFRELEIGLADASIVVLADRFGSESVLTLDERHFRALRTSAGKAFTLLPADMVA